MNRVDCGEVRDLLTAYLDGELAVSEQSVLTEHLASCPECARLYDAQAALRARIRYAGTFKMPAALEARVRDRLGLADRERSNARRRGLLVGSHLVAAALGALLLYGTMTYTTSNERIVRDAMSAHARALISGSLVQVASSDQHTVKPWLSERVPFSPPIMDTPPADFSFLGGRVDVLADRPAAVAVYARRMHKIDVFMQPRETSAIVADLSLARNGNNVLTWRVGDFAFLAVSDLNVSELRQLTQSLAAGAQASAP